ncbi:harmonin-like isoform X2 [Tubulanus polymorphus]|uniref:harmonin-like isoform X2 n=1 Tax=Tubulanus polymorphus TaxID=672921 RepID=UPI003DA5F128
MMERRVAKEFNTKVQNVLPDEPDREVLYAVLRRYQSTLDLQALIAQLRDVIDNPIKMQLYDDIRPLIPLKHQIEYDRLAPPKPSEKLRVIRLRRSPTESLGFAVRGGLEHGVGIFVSHVLPDSQAALKGLRVGDQIVRVNGFTIDQAIHEEVLNLIKSRSEIILKVRRVGMIPVRDTAADPVSWKYVDYLDSSKLLQHVLDGVENENHEVKLFVNMAGSDSFGCSICSGPVHKPGIFIQSIRVGSLAEESGIQVGDQIVDVNGTSFLNISHSEAVVALKSSCQLTITIRKGAGSDLFCPRLHPGMNPDDEKSFRLQQMTLLKEKELREKNDKESKVLAEERRQKDEAEAKLRQQTEQEEKRRRAAALERQREQEREQIRKKLEEEERRKRLEKEENERIRKEEEERNARELQDELMRISIEEQEREQEKIAKEAEELMREQEIRRKTHGATEPVHHIPHVLNPSSSSSSGVPASSSMPRPQSPETSQLESRVIVNVNPRAQPLKSMMKASKGNYRGSKSPKFQEECTIIEDVKLADEMKEENFDASKLFTPQQIAGRTIALLTIDKDFPLDIAIEGGTDSPLAGKIIVSDIFPGGAVDRHGGIHKGDQLMIVDKSSLLDITLAQAQNILKEASKKATENIQVVIAKAPPKNYEDEITRPDYMIPISDLDELIAREERAYDERKNQFAADDVDGDHGDADLPISFI